MKADNKAENERKRQSEGVTLGRLSPQLHKSQTHTHTQSAKEWVSCQTASSFVCLCVPG